jgi:hypothetical protein
MKTNETTTRTATQNAAQEAASFNPAAMLPAQNFGDLCFDYFGKGSVIVFGNVPDHVQQLEALGGRFSFNLHYSPLQNGRKWSRKMGTTRGFYFTSEKSKREAVAYVRAINNALFDKYTAAARGVDLSRQTPADFKAGDRVRTIHGTGTVTEHTPQYNAARSVVVKLDKFTYNYGWQGMPQTFIEVSTAEVVHYTEPAKSEPTAQERDEIDAAYIMEGGQLIKAEESKTSVFCGFYAACGYNGQKAGDLFAVLSGPILAPAYNADGHRLNAGANRAGMSYSPTSRKWYKD